MRDRISKAKAYIAVRNYNAAIYELENIRKRVGRLSSAVRRECAADEQLSRAGRLQTGAGLSKRGLQRPKNDQARCGSQPISPSPARSSAAHAIASSVIEALGLDPSNRTLPLEAINDLENMRETLELVVTQAKEIGKDNVKSPRRDGDARRGDRPHGACLPATTMTPANGSDEVADIREDHRQARAASYSGAVNDRRRTDTANQAVAQNSPQQNSVITATSYKQPATQPNAIRRSLNRP